MGSSTNDLTTPHDFTSPLAFTREVIEKAPNLPGVHIVWTRDREALFVGATNDLRRRLRQHLVGGGSILRDKVSRRLQASTGRSPTPEELRDYFAGCWIAWRQVSQPDVLKAELMDELQPELNEIRPSSTEQATWELVREQIDAGLTALQGRENGTLDEAYHALLTGDLPAALGALMGEAFSVRGRVGIGDLADVPWVGLFASDDASAKRGVYAVLLFAFDGSRAYLTINQGTENLKGGLPVLEKRVLDIRSVIDSQPDLLTTIDLKSTNQRPKRYAAGTAYATEYAASGLPSAEQLESDFHRFGAMLESVLESGLSFDSQREPVHLVMKWNPEYRPSTILDHRDVAEKRGSVWWGKNGTPGTTAMGAPRIELVREQLDDGVETHCYLYRRGEIWKTVLEEITADPDEVDSRLPGYYTTSDCNLFVRIKNFEQLDPDWAVENLLLASKPEPAAVAGALSNQTSPLLVYERFSRSSNHMPKAQLTLEWLAERTLWDPAALTDVVDALTERPQVILAGPPGTGKTWVAKHLARYLTQDHPLASRVLQFHPSYGYEEFIEGLRPNSVGGTFEFARVDGAVLKTVNQIATLTGQTHVLILDEMNRANLPRVFGELMYLLEYRDEPADLLYSQDFTLPQELMFIGTMNTADRSIRSIDIALRRRFEIFECFPNRAILERFYNTAANEVPDLLDGFDTLNARLTELIDRHHTIGHTFFMADPMTPARLQNTWERQLAPLLEEYFFDQSDVASTFSLEDLWPSVSN